MFVNSQNILLDDPNNKQGVFIKVFFDCSKHVTAYEGAGH